MTDSGWITTPLPRLLSIMKSGGTPSTSRSDFYGGDIPFVSIEDMTACEKYLRSTKKKLTQAGLDGSNAWLVPSNSILYSIYATLGIPRINLVPVATNQAILAMICRAELVDQGFLYYWLDYARESLVNSSSSQTTQKNLSKSVIGTFAVDHPSAVPEQSKIAEVLSTVDRAIAQTEALIAKQQRIKTGLMQDLLTRGIDEHGQLRSEATHAFKDSPLGRIPVEWEVEALGRIATVSGGKRLPAGHSYAKGKTGYVYLRVLDFFNREIDVDSLVSLESETFQALQRYEICHGELCISIAGSLGYVSVLRLRADIRAILTENALRIVPGNEVDGDYLYMAMNGLAVQKQVEALKGTGGGVPKLALHRVKSLSLAFPRDQAEQQRIVERVAAHAMNASQIDKALRKLRHLKTALMQDLLTGKVRVTPLLQQVVASANPQAKPAQRQRAAHTTLNPQPRIS